MTHSYDVLWERDSGVGGRRVVERSHWIPRSSRGMTCSWSVELGPPVKPGDAGGTLDPAVEPGDDGACPWKRSFARLFRPFRRLIGRAGKQAPAVFEGDGGNVRRRRSITRLPAFHHQHRAHRQILATPAAPDQAVG